MTTTHNPPRRTRKTSTRTRRRLRLPRLGWWWLTIAITVIAAIRTWPLYTSLATALIAVATIVAVVRPRRLARPLNWATTIANTITSHRRRLPTRRHRTLHTFLHLTPTGFEHAIAELALEDDNVHSAQQVGQANDRGADVLVHLRDGRRILVQCKHHQPGNNVGSPVLQTINGVYRDIHGCHAAVIVTTANFTPAAYDTNTMLQHPIRLIDGHALTAWANGGPPPWA